MKRIVAKLSSLAVALSVMAVVHSQGLPRSYTYDATGNRLTAKNLVRFTSVSTFGIEPRRAFTGDRLNIYGRNFPAGVNKDAVVKFGALTAKILNVGERVITVEVPANLTSGDITLSIKGGAAMQVGKLTIQGVTVTPSVVELDHGQTQQFAAKVIGGTTTTVTWSVTDLQGETSNVGTISSTGLYTAPALGRARDFPFLVRATNAAMRVTGYALVKLKPHKITKISNRTFVAGSFTKAHERHAFEFTGAERQYVFSAFFGTAAAASFTLRDANGVALARSGPGKVLKVPDMQLAETGVYRVEAQGPATAGSSYRVWVDLHGRLPRARWLLPASGAWEDEGNWSRADLPRVRDDVVIPRQGGTTITLGNGEHRCTSVVSDVDVVLAGGRLEVEKSVQVHGRLRLAGGTLANATVLPGSGQFPFVVDANSGLDGVKLGVATSVDAGAIVTVQNDLTLLDIQVKMSNGRLLFPGPGQKSLTGKGEVWFVGTKRSYVDTDALGVLVLGKDVTVRGGHGGIGTHGEATFFNEGTISLGVPGRSLVLKGKNWVNRGTIELSAAGSITLDGETWTNSGRITATGGGTLITAGKDWVNGGLISSTASTLVLGGSFKLDPSGAFTRRGGFVELTGQLDNSEQKLAFRAGESWNVKNGTIRGGTIEGAEALVFVGNGTLDGVTLKAPIRVVDGRVVTVENDLVLDSTIELNHGHVMFKDSQTLSGSGVVAFRSTSNSSLYAAAGKTLTIGSGITVVGGSGIVGATNSTFVNEGKIQLVRNRTIELKGASWVNRGDVVGSPGGSLKLGGSAWKNEGTVLLSGVGTLSISGADWRNEGLITVEGAGTMNVSGQKWINAKDLIIRAGASATLGGTDWKNTGKISLTTAALQFAGSFELDPGGVFQRQGGTVVLTGVLDNKARTLAFGQSGDTWLVRGGGITGGTVTGGLGLIFEKSAKLDGVTMNAPFHVTGGSVVSIENDLILNATARLNHGDLAFKGKGEQVLTGQATVEVLGAAVSHVYAADDGGALKIDANITLVGGNGSVGKRKDLPFTLLGTAKIGVPGRRLSFVGTNWVNRGTIEASGGGQLVLDGTDYVNRGTIGIRGGGTLGFAGKWRNEGTISMTTSTVNFGGTEFALMPNGSFTRLGGFVNLSGILDNTGRTLTFQAAQDVWSVKNGGGIKKGTVAGGEGLVFTENGVLDGVTMTAPFRVISGSTVTVTNNLTLDAKCTLNHGNLLFKGSQSLRTTNKQGEVFFAGASTSYVHADSTNTLTIESDVTLRGGNGAVGRLAGATFVNKGRIEASSAGRSIALIGKDWRNTGGVLTATNGGILVTRGTGSNPSPMTWAGTGTLRVEGIFTVTGKYLHTLGTAHVVRGGTLASSSDVEVTGGTLSGDGTVQAARLVNRATVAPGGVGSVGSLSVSGAFLQDANGTLAIEIDSNKTFDAITFTGSVQIAGSLCTKLLNNAKLADKDQFKVMTHAAPLPTGRFTLPCDAPGTGLKWSPQYAATSLTLVVTK